MCANQVLCALLGICCVLEYEKPAAVRLAATAAGTLLYFRNTALVSSATTDNGRFDSCRVL